MPIAQDRIITLITIIDQALAEREQIHKRASIEVGEALAEFYHANGNENALASSILARLQSLASSILDNPRGLSSDAIEVLAREREHFRIKQSSNILARNAMRRRRGKTTTSKGSSHEELGI